MFQQLFQPSIRNISPGEAEVGLEYLDLSPHPALAHGRRWHGSHAQPASVGGGESRVPGGGETEADLAATGHFWAWNHFGYPYVGYSIYLIKQGAGRCFFQPERGEAPLYNNLMTYHCSKIPFTCIIMFHHPTAGSRVNSGCNVGLGHGGTVIPHGAQYAYTLYWMTMSHIPWPWQVYCNVMGKTRVFQGKVSHVTNGGSFISVFLYRRLQEKCPQIGQLF